MTISQSGIRMISQLIIRMNKEMQCMMQLYIFSIYVHYIVYFCEAQARVRQGSARNGKEWQSRRKASKLKPLPRAYTKVGCHPPTRKSQYTVPMGHYDGSP